MTSPRVRAVVACLGFFLITLDASIVNVALPAMGQELRTGVTGLSWIVDGYTVSLAGVIVVAGVGADRFGSPRVFRWGLVSFGVTSALCAVAPSVGMLIAARVLQGVAGAVVLPSSMAVAAGAYDDPGLRRKVLGWWAAGGGVAVAAGPVVGGVLVDALGWQAVFLVNVPVAALGAIVVNPGRQAVAEARGLDLVGQLYLIVCLTSGVFALIEVGHGASPPAAVVSTAVFLVSGIGVGGRARSGSPAVPVDQLRRRGVLLAVLTGAALNVTFFGVVFALSLMLQQHYRLSAGMTGLVMLPASVIIVAANLAASHSIERCGTTRTLLLGLICEGAGFGLAAVAIAVVSTHPGWWLALALLPAGAGAGLASPAMLNTLMDATDPTQSGAMAGFLNASRQAGTAVGVAVAGVWVSAAGPNGGGLGVCVLASSALFVNALGVARHERRHRSRSIWASSPSR